MMFGVEVLLSCLFSLCAPSFQRWSLRSVYSCSKCTSVSLIRLRLPSRKRSRIYIYNFMSLRYSATRLAIKASNSCLYSGFQRERAGRLFWMSPADHSIRAISSFSCTSCSPCQHLICEGRGEHTLSGQMI